MGQVPCGGGSRLPELPLQIAKDGSQPSTPRKTCSEKGDKQDDCPILLEEEFPMHTISMSTFLSLARMRPFCSLRAQGAVRPAEAAAVVHFISHEWLGWQHPDPDGVQLRRMQGVFRSLLSGDLQEVLPPDLWASFSARVSATLSGAYREAEAAGRTEAAESLPDIFKQHVQFGDVWLDFASIPQLVTTGDPEARSKRELVMLAAVRSIPAYLERSRYFWVLAPSATHVDKKTPCNFASWRSRGWCRLEEWANFLSTDPCPPLIITHAKHARTMGFMEFALACAGKPDLAPCAGAFTCCSSGHRSLPGTGVQKLVRSLSKGAIPCDKCFIFPVLQALLARKKEHLRADASKKFLHASLVALVEPMLFGGAPMQPVDQEAETIPEFLDRFALASVSDVSPPHLSVWHHAASLNHVPMLRKLLAEPKALAQVQSASDLARLDLVTCAAMQGSVEALALLLEGGLVRPEALNERQGTLGIAALDRAAKGGFADMVTFLLLRRADVDPRRADGSTPLHGAADAGHAACCRVLLAWSADANAVDALGRSPLHLAVDPVTFYGNACNKLDVVEVLLQHRADPLLQDAAGRTALDVARAAHFGAAERQLLAGLPAERKGLRHRVRSWAAGRHQHQGPSRGGA